MMITYLWRIGRIPQQVVEGVAMRWQRLMRPWRCSWGILNDRLGLHCGTHRDEHHSSPLGSLEKPASPSRPSQFPSELDHRDTLAFVTQSGEEYRLVQCTPLDFGGADLESGDRMNGLAMGRGGDATSLCMICTGEIMSESSERPDENPLLALKVVGGAEVSTFGDNGTVDSLTNVDTSFVMDKMQCDAIASSPKANETSAMSDNSPKRWQAHTCTSNRNEAGGFFAGKSSLTAMVSGCGMMGGGFSPRMLMYCSLFAPSRCDSRSSCAFFAAGTGSIDGVDVRRAATGEGRMPHSAHSQPSVMRALSAAPVEIMSSHACTGREMAHERTGGEEKRRTASPASRKTQLYVYIQLG